MSMEEIKSLVPFEGQVQCPSPEDDLLWLLDYFSSNPDIDQLLQLQQVEPNSVSIAESTNESAGPLDPLDGELVWGNPDYPGIAGDNSDLLVDPMDFNLEPIKPEDKLSEFLGTGYENTIPVSIRPQPWVPLSCSCCQVIRDIRHTNGTEATRLEIHGRVGVICHAILEIQDGVAPNTQYHMTE
ncbi:PREDICTED: uncharacterized protein LOC104606795 [Nelumbo nucifera]|uniref:Uncharacterized protein LOC104606795 n=1 Tax=Nelumbo nucifera TaxID=4432 RepID=A0A1U8ARU5_NELNU|nr:PREDICTED: uncharacterized protein LOC104606795 [Nelumbo nucifera]